MKNKALFFLCLLFFAVSCTDNEEDFKPTQNNTEPASIEELKSLVIDQLNKGDVFYWTKSSDHTIWSAGMQSDSIFSIGYKPASVNDISSVMDQLDLQDNDWLDARKKVEETILKYTFPKNKKAEINQLMPQGEVLHFPQIIVQLSDLKLIEALRKMPEVRYVEPIGFSLEDAFASQRSGSGCSSSPNYSINSNDYSNVAPDAKVPWNYYKHEIDQAWNNSTGDDATICIIDTGADDDQDNLGSDFQSGYSSGRYIHKFSTHYTGSWWWRKLDSPNDQCGHGTSMAGLAAGPRSNDGNSTGVAYKSNLISIRAVADVIISTSNERAGVRDALYLAGNRSDVKIISMSIGTPFYSSTVADGVYFAYNKGKTMFAAAGTSLSWLSWYPVIFPANMSQCSAITGVRDQSNNQRCDVCHSGSEVEYVVVMQRSNNVNRNSISLAGYSNQPKYIGGSSCATATVAGVAALVASENPGYNRSSILNALKQTSQYYPNRNGEFGWGRIDAAAAVNY